jgi:NADPH:quinone reductase-like Zn-dependent oxidoreductase
MMACVEEQRVQPAISAEYAFADAPAALADISAGQHFGKLVVNIAED